ncbi:MAG: asparagine synthase (glutamine-hydrolyzing) [Legionellales bacterium]|nr:asparagine synthase (glutamine-hydrolyzing) [Legionellales bacterium]OUX66212.1 MAG: asparagine synthase (glutamine-hydrolyzing) [Gammaproteobacteria bacterium TMED281]
MCGYYLSLSKQKINHDLKKIEDTLKLRGPDFTGISSGKYKEFFYSALHCRLSIIDLTTNSNQPCCNENGILVFNGEIYNYQKLQKRYNLKLCNNDTVSDTKVLWALLEKFGVSILSELQGMFSFVYLDKRNAKIIFSIDKFGVKPLFFRNSAEEMVFSSDPRCVSLFNKNDINHEVRDQFLSKGWINPGKSIFKHVESLMPSSYGMIDLSNTKCVIKRYDILKTNSVKISSVKETVDTDQLEEILTKSIKARYKSDVPICSLLSGGIDSGLGIALAKRNLNENIQTYTFKFAESSYSEADQARAIAEIYSDNHREISISEFELETICKDLIEKMAEPFADVSAIPLFKLFNEIRKDFKVAMSYDGGDEFFYGYQKYINIKKIQNSKFRIPLKYNPWKIPQRFFPYHYAKIYGAISNKPSGLALNYLHFPGWYKILKKTNIASAYKYDNKLVSIEEIRNFDIGHYMHKNILNKIDCVSMYCSVEAREPFLSPELYNFASSLGISGNIEEKFGKVALRQFAKKFLPREITNMEKKGFSVPINKWLRGPLKSLVSTSMEQSKLIPELDQSEVIEVCKSFLNCRYNNGKFIWAVIVYIRWRLKNGELH